MSALRICSYNIAGAINEDSRFYSARGTAETARRVERARAAIDQICERLASEDLDIIALQEVDVCWNGDDTVRQADVIAEALSMDVCYQPSFDYNLLGRARVTTGLATLSRTPITGASEIRFPQSHVGLAARLKSRLLGSKKALETRHEIGGVELSVINAHLTHQAPRQRELELTRLVARCRELDRVVLAGDLNTTPHPTRADDMVEPESFRADRCMEILVAAGLSCDPRLGFGDEAPAGHEALLSYPSDAPSIKLDYILGFGDLEVGGERVLDLTASNHAPVIATISAPRS